jgi:hypothetical protein
LLICAVVALGFLVAQVVRSTDIDRTGNIFYETPDTVVEEETDNYRISVTIPGVAPTPAAREIGALIHGEIQDFKVMMETSVHETSLPWVLDISYSLHEFNIWITFVIQESLYTGGVHSTDTVRSFTYNIETGDSVAIDDLVSQDQLASISEIAKSALSVQLGVQRDSSFIDSGTVALYGNFDTFFFTPEGIVFVFQMYQVAPYSQGVPEILLPYDLLEEKAGLVLFEEVYTSGSSEKNI